MIEGASAPGDHAPQTPGVFLYYTGRRQGLPKLRAFNKYAKEHLPPAPLLSDA